MKLHDLNQTNNWFSVELVLLQLYPDQDTMLEEYSDVYDKLKNLDPEEGNMSIVLTENDRDDFEESGIKTYVDVSGQDGAKDENGKLISYAIEFVEWKKWLGMDLAQETLNKFSELEIIAHCIYEMTFIGFDEIEIKEIKGAYESDLEEYENLTEEEKQQRTISLDDMMKELDEEEDL